LHGLINDMQGQQKPLSRLDPVPEAILDVQIELRGAEQAMEDILQAGSIEIVQDRRAQQPTGIAPNEMRNQTDRVPNPRRAWVPDGGPFFAPKRRNALRLLRPTVLMVELVQGDKHQRP